jgi:hypothetical protein
VVGVGVGKLGFGSSPRHGDAVEEQVALQLLAADAAVVVGVNLREQLRPASNKPGKARLGAMPCAGHRAGSSSGSLRAPAGGGAPPTHLAQSVLDHRLGGVVQVIQPQILMGQVVLMGIAGIKHRPAQVLRLNLFAALHVNRRPRVWRGVHLATGRCGRCRCRNTTNFNRYSKVVG